MKKTIVTLFIALFTLAAAAQTVEEGNSHLYYGRYKSAEETFRKIIQSQPASQGGWYGIVKSLLLQDRASEAATLLSTAPVSVRNEPYFLVAAGAASLELGRIDSAKMFFDEALNQTRNKDAGIMSVIASAHIDADAGQPSVALNLLEQAIKRDKRNGHYDVLKGDAFRKMLNASEAYKSYKEAIEKNGSLAEAYHKLGDIFLSQKNPEMYLEYFNKAVAADPNYAPSLYQLYSYEFARNPIKAREYFLRYQQHADAGPDIAYQMADIYYINKDYPVAVEKAKGLVSTEGKALKPRIYKLLAYSYAGMKDTAQAITWMQQYFDKEADSNFIAMDFASMADFQLAAGAGDSVVAVLYEKALQLEQDSSQLHVLSKRLADFASASKDYSAQAKWLARYYDGNDKVTNLDLFNWALAHYRAEEFRQADSVFGLYVAKYPEQSFGYYWQAKAKAMQDKDMKQGLAIPVYQK
ncbi:MAG TPA: tetratricopeptide repeat protein, partial [Flavisolibacter sp.]